MCPPSSCPRQRSWLLPSPSCVSLSWTRSSMVDFKVSLMTSSNEVGANAVTSLRGGLVCRPTVGRWTDDCVGIGRSSWSGDWRRGAENWKLHVCGVSFKLRTVARRLPRALLVTSGEEAICKINISECLFPAYAVGHELDSHSVEWIPPQNRHQLCHLESATPCPKQDSHVKPAQARLFPLSQASCLVRLSGCDTMSVAKAQCESVDSGSGRVATCGSFGA
ncbi:hypothetical protein K491DRAFT_271716 [Lophiostoma macrostomum CBS 122681]|uniref:Uncharacterized protein n=1 Tax=Lophiostoma macrostomum CBS 122681 TaxID=1314788 RepID=A0A6A6SLS3_9PLEO|nr:hypothetical protein K491DRAFT_271716 [Lophiostoma macrostomum CBS 122681]